MTAAADRNLLFGLLALQNGLIDRGVLVDAFPGWTLHKSRSLADQLVARGDLNDGACTGLEPPPSRLSSCREVVPPAILTRRCARSQTVVLGWIPPGP